MKVTRKELIALIKAKDWKAVENADVSEITDMSYIFGESKFNGDIGEWDVSNAENMHCMFYGSKFNGDIRGWNVSNILNMGWMFYKSEFNGDISGWVISKRMLKESHHPNPYEEHHSVFFLRNYDINGIRLWKLANL